jgi:hypothetical protein
MYDITHERDEKLKQNITRKFEKEQITQKT